MTLVTILSVRVHGLIYRKCVASPISTSSMQSPTVTWRLLRPHNALHLLVIWITLLLAYDITVASYSGSSHPTSIRVTRHNHQFLIKGFNTSPPQVHFHSRLHPSSSTPPPQAPPLMLPPPPPGSPPQAPLTLTTGVAASPGCSRRLRLGKELQSLVPLELLSPIRTSIWFRNWTLGCSRYELVYCQKSIA